MRGKRLLTIIVVVLAVIGGGFFICANANANNVVIKNHQIVKGEDAWDNFKKNTASGKSETIHVIMDENGKCYDNTLSFDGTYFQYANEQENKTYKRKYLLDLKGEIPVSKVMTRWVVLADQQYTLEDLTNSVESNDSGDWLDFDIIFLD